MHYAVRKRIRMYAITQLLNTQYAFKTRKRNDFTTQLKPVLRQHKAMVIQTANYTYLYNISDSGNFSASDRIATLPVRKDK